MLLLIDNYDSFTYNLVHYLGELGAETQVLRNDQLSVSEAMTLRPAGIVISPGPGNPKSAGICIDLIKRAAPDIPILGVCLGHQSIGEAFGGDVIHAPTVMHGKLSSIAHADTGIFKGLPGGFQVTRYHSLTVDPDTLPDCLEVTAQTEDGVIMGLAHKQYQTYGVQFHPESIATEYGHKLLENFLRLAEVPLHA